MMCYERFGKGFTIWSKKSLGKDETRCTSRRILAKLVGATMQGSAGAQDLRRHRGPQFASACILT
jgi:hypothetical protein